MRYSRIRATVGAVGVAVALVATATPANASITGGVYFVCRAKLAVFPSPNAGGSCAAGAPVPGSALGAAAGVDSQGHVYAVVGLGTFSAAFGYNETCPPPPAPALPVVPLVGTATGTASITGLTAVDSSSPGVIWGARVDTNFQWVRVGLTAVIITHSTKITLTNGHVAVSASPVSALVDDAGVAAFAPLPPPVGPGLGNCAAPAPTDAAVVGADVVPV